VYKGKLSEHNRIIIETTVLNELQPLFVCMYGLVLKSEGLADDNLVFYPSCCSSFFGESVLDSYDYTGVRLEVCWLSPFVQLLHFCRVSRVRSLDLPCSSDCVPRELDANSLLPLGPEVAQADCTYQRLGRISLVAAFQSQHFAGMSTLQELARSM